MRIVDIMKESRYIETIDFEGCNLTLSDIEYINTMLLANKKSGIKKIRLGLNKFTEE